LKFSGMTRGVCLYLVGSFVLATLAGCGHGFFSEEREPWRAEAEAACLKSGAVREGPDLVRISPISGPGACGADFPLKVAALGESNGSFGFADEDLRPPAAIGNQPRWPAGQPPPPPSSYYPDQPYRAPNYGGPSYRSPDYGAPSDGPISLRAPGVAPDQDDIPLPSEGASPGWRSGPSSPYAPHSNDPRGRYAPASVPPGGYDPPRLGPGPMQPFPASGPVAIKPAATLACPIVSVLDRWLTDTVQPAAQRWFGQRVVEIKQISAYSCRGRNGDGTNLISEHAFGNALDVAAFSLADGRRIVVESGWKGLPEEQGFLRDVEAGACHHFTTVLAPGSNAAHYNHIHVDLRRRSGRDICSPLAVSGEEVAARVGARFAAHRSEEPSFTSSVGQRNSSKKAAHDSDDDDDD
jgi:Extensin-like protein C-terminus